jgi:hypothetical protein
MGEYLYIYKYIYLYCITFKKQSHLVGFASKCTVCLCGSTRLTRERHPFVQAACHQNGVLCLIQIYRSKEPTISRKIQHGGFFPPCGMSVDDDGQRLPGAGEAANQQPGLAERVVRV